MDPQSKKMLMTFLLLVVLGLQIAAISTNHWSKASNVLTYQGVSVDITWGLWKLCADAPIPKLVEIDMCVDLPHNSELFKKNSLSAVRALSIAGAVLVFMGMMCYWWNPLLLSNCKCLLVLLGSLLIIVGAVVWGAELLKIVPPASLAGDNAAPLKGKPCASYWLSMSAGILGLLTSAWCWFER